MKFLVPLIALFMTATASSQNASNPISVSADTIIAQGRVVASALDKNVHGQNAWVMLIAYEDALYWCRVGAKAECSVVRGE